MSYIDVGEDGRQSQIRFGGPLILDEAVKVLERTFQKSGEKKSVYFGIQVLIRNFKHLIDIGLYNG